MVQMMTVYWRWYNDIYADVDRRGPAWIGEEMTMVPAIPRCTGSGRSRDHRAVDRWFRCFQAPTRSTAGSPRGEKRSAHRGRRVGP
ncbi:hypothetical protein EAG_09103 [Camponotus floridanus]|uniref:Uncharacterized protein n=1 Tax=Camponotus floridanus TaxID=104421 RepID=E2AHB2_CAMFO|nr:hypothetical protein EAG_09103 [Camponotus floridanus]